MTQRSKKRRRGKGPGRSKKSDGSLSVWPANHCVICGSKIDENENKTANDGRQACINHFELLLDLGRLE